VCGGRERERRRESRASRELGRAYWVALAETGGGVDDDAWAEAGDEGAGVEGKREVSRGVSVRVGRGGGSVEAGGGEAGA